MPPTTEDNTSCKENNGKASKKKLTKSIIILITSCFVIVSTLRLIVGVTTHPQRSSKLKDDDVSLDNYMNRKRRNNHERNRQRGGAGMPDFMGGGFRGDLFESNPKRSLYNRDTLPDDAQDMTEEELILSSTVHMGGISRIKQMSYIPSNSYAYNGVNGIFCKIDWDLHKTTPAKYAMNRDLIGHSEDCRYTFSYDLATIVQKAREYDATHPEVRAMEPTGFVFHESRCGSTMIANSLAISNPSEHRVWSESRPPIEVILHCQDTVNYSDCDKQQTIQLLRDVIYMMGRTRDPNEKRLFFKIQSIGTQHMNILLEAFPNTPWVYLYRDPVHVMMSHLDMPRKERANCMRHKSDPHVSVKNILRRFGVNQFDLSVEEYCAIHLASLDETAYNAYQNHPHGLLVNYNSLPNALIEEVFPNHFNIPITEVEKENILRQSTQYSKQKNPKKGTTFEGDNERKERRATDEVLDASRKYMSPGYDRLEAVDSTVTTNH